MKFRRSLAVTRRIFKDLRNDKRTIGLIFLAPIFAMFIFGLAFSGDVKDASVVIVNNDEGFTPPFDNFTSLSEGIISNLDREVLEIEFLEDETEAIDKVENGEAYAVIILPENFTRDVYTKTQSASFSGNTTIELMMDRTNINVADAIAKTLNSAVIKTMEEEGTEAVISVDSEDAIYGKNADFMDFFVPGIIAFVVYFLTTILTLISFVGERTSGTLDRILATPVTEGEIVAGYAMAFSVFGTLQALLLLIVGIVVFDITIIGHVALAFACIALLAVVCQALGILLSSLARREAQAIQLLPFVVLPAFLLSGIFWPIEAIPKWLRPASYLIPPTYTANACRAVMLRGWGLDMIWTDMLALLIFAMVFLTLAIVSLKKRR